jgi:hypothetical protein
MLHYVRPGACKELRRLGRQVRLGHRPVELRLRHGLIPRRQQLLGRGTVSGFEAFGFTRYLVSGVKVPACAAEYPVSFLHGRFSSALEHGGSRLRRLASSGRVSEGFYRILPVSLKWSQIWSQCDQKRARPEQFHLASNDLRSGSGGRARQKKPFCRNDL